MRSVGILDKSHVRSIQGPSWPRPAFLSQFIFSSSTGALGFSYIGLWQCLDMLPPPTTGNSCSSFRMVAETGNLFLLRDTSFSLPLLAILTSHYSSLTRWAAATEACFSSNTPATHHPWGFGSAVPCSPDICKTCSFTYYQGYLHSELFSFLFKTEHPLYHIHPPSSFPALLFSIAFTDPQRVVSEELVI